MRHRAIVLAFALLAAPAAAQEVRDALDARDLIEATGIILGTARRGG